MVYNAVFHFLIIDAKPSNNCFFYLGNCLAMRKLSIEFTRAGHADSGYHGAFK